MSGPAASMYWDNVNKSFHFGLGHAPAAERHVQYTENKQARQFCCPSEQCWVYYVPFVNIPYDLVGKALHLTCFAPLSSSSVRSGLQRLGLLAVCSMFSSGFSGHFTILVSLIQWLLGNNGLEHLSCHGRVKLEVKLRDRNLHSIKMFSRLLNWNHHARYRFNSSNFYYICFSCKEMQEIACIVLKIVFFFLNTVVFFPGGQRR